MQLAKLFISLSIYICGGYSLLLEVKECFRLDLNSTEIGWVQIAPMLKGRFEFHLVAARGLLYAIGGQGPFSEHADIEVSEKIVYFYYSFNLKKECVPNR